jgi:hypothetical protein
MQVLSLSVTIEGVASYDDGVVVKSSSRNSVSSDDRAALVPMVSGVFSWQYALPRQLDTAARGRPTISLDSAKGHSKICGIFFDDPYWEEDANLKLSYCWHRAAPAALRAYVRALPDQSANVVRPSKCEPIVQRLPKR